MSEPSRSEIELPLLQAIQDMGGSVAVPSHALYEKLRSALNLQADEYDPVHARPKWIYTLQWVRYNLVKKGLMDGKERGVWKITEAGVKALKTGETDAGPGILPARGAKLKPTDVIYAICV